MIVRAGRGSLHAGWAQRTGEAEFDLLVAAYQAGAPGGAEGFNIFLPGRKIAGYHSLFEDYPEILTQYEYIALIDDDIETTAHELNRLFGIGRQYNLDLFQPALAWDSHFSYAATLTNRKHYVLRYTNTVEMMCPVFSAKYLAAARSLFGLGYETGIDLLWTRLTDSPWLRYAIVDDVVVRHTRPVGTTKSLQGFAANEPYDVQVDAVLKRFGAAFHGFVTYAAVDRRGQLIRSRFLIGLNSLSLWRALFRTPLNWTQFMRRSTDYTRHCWLRPVNLQRIDVDGVVKSVRQPQRVGRRLMQ
ncbi:MULTISPECIES: DUF707 domain-containing protein [unclassified Mesorhizobium]|uniref:DUF707 domain-containing protein n=1 Tax=unclassified Mesorhizobium TaxID=325217 RepID=UPI0003CFC0F3|nr:MULTISPECIES: DUF707 domain-containing protein [unclassified Mesorhizobium]ESZ19170.1 hypothetical protein X737_15340 [Mesorhizobium sp. L48C026A00]